MPPGLPPAGRRRSVAEQHWADVWAEGRGRLSLEGLFAVGGEESTDTAADWADGAWEEEGGGEEVAVQVGAPVDWEEVDAARERQHR